MKRFFSLTICAAMLLGAFAGAYAENTQSRAVIGADLTNEQISLVYQIFGISQGSVPQLRLTNAEERKFLEGYVDSAVIGTRSISCVYVELLSPGSGMKVTTNNITWCDSDFYISALSTAGITDARIIVTAPFPVSGTAALAGIYKAYEDMTGQTLDSDAKDVGTQELTVTGELAQEIGSTDSGSIVQELKRMLSETGKMTDEQLREEIVKISSGYHVSLTDTQIKQLVSLCRSLERLDPDTFKSKVDDVQGTISKVSGAKSQIEEYIETIRNIIASLQSIIERIQSILDKFG